MRILQNHVDFIEYEPIEKEIKIAETVEKKKYRFEDGLVLFTCVEEGDNEKVAQKVVKELKEFLEKVRVNKILIYPYAHLSQNLAEPKKALELLKKMEEYAKKLKIEVSRAPFGWNKKFTLSIKPHPLAEMFRVYTPEKDVRIEEKVKRVGKKPAIPTEKLPEHDHRILGPKLGLFTFSEFGPGVAFFHHHGMTLRNILIDFWRREHKKRGYLEINTPILLSEEIWKISGHWDHYKDLMFFTSGEEIDYALKPMNCPGAILVFKSASRSYKDLPLRLAELGLVSRNELSGVLTGLFRMRVFTQDDAHIFVTEEQIEDEISEIIRLIDYFYKIFNFPYRVKLSTRPEKFMGSKEVWDKAEDSLKKALNKNKIKYEIDPGEGAFYGPKIDFHIKDSLGREWQLATIQLDFLMPERFDVSYVGKDGKLHRPVIIHRVIYGSIERFIGILVEHYQGKFPLWLSPIQLRILPISQENLKYAKKIAKEVEESGLRVDLDIEGTIEYRIRNAQLQKIPYMIIVGKREEKNETIAVRNREGKVKYDVKLEDFIKQTQKEIKKFLG
ncbi:MAG: threonine--tRNA ligase [Candidatus Aenigmatarchaeota archaeon]